MATIKPTTSVSFDNSTSVKENDNFQLFLKNNLYKQFENQNLIRQFDLSTLERLMDSTLSNQHLNWPNDANLLNNTSTLQINNEKLAKNKQDSNRKSSRGSEEEDPEKSGASDFELIDEEMINSEQSAFLNNVSNLTNQLSQSNHFSLNQNLNDDNSTIESSNDNLLIENQDSKSSDNEFSLNKLTRSQSGRRKSSSRLARQIGDGITKSCHLCTFVTENKLEYQAHMDKHYEHRCKRCGYGCRTKGRLNRHIRESHPDLANELESGDGKRKKRNHNNSNKSSSNLDKYGNSLEKVVSYRNHIQKPATTIIKVDNDNFNNTNLSNAGSDSTIINDSLDQLNNNQLIDEQLNESLNKHLKQQNSTITQSKLDNQQSNQPSPSSIPDDISEHSQLSASFEQNKQKQETIPSDQSKLFRYRKYTCKQCSHISTSKKESWDHGKIHIKQDKLLSCPHDNCGFSTGYKHHLEYHLRKHFKSKPFKCIKCSYTCINKSMLASHLKSHSNVYQFRCENCPYATKYMHSLKQHLRKYNHKPDRILNLDGSENPYPIIDVYGTRRGPRPKKGVGSLKLIKQVLSDNNHLVADPDKVEKIVSTLTEQNPEEGDEKLFSLMRSNEEKDVRVDLQLHHIISEQLKANSTTQIEDTNTTATTANIASSIKSFLNQQQQQQQQQQQSNQQLINKNQNINKVLNKSTNQSSSVNFVKERVTNCSTSVLSKLNSFCKSPKKSDQNKSNESLPSLNNNETDEKSTQLSKSILNNLLMGEHGFALARSLLNPSLFNSSLLNPALFNPPTNSTNEKEKDTQQLDNYSAQFITNQLLHNHLLTQFKNDQYQLNKEFNNNNNETVSPSNFVAQLAFNLALSGQQQTNSINFNNNNNNSNNSNNTNNNNLNLLNYTSQEWTEQLANHLINNNLLNPAIFNLNLPNLLNQTIFNQNLLNSSNFLNNKQQQQQNSSPDLLNNHNVTNNSNYNISNNLKNLTTPTTTNSMFSNWQSYLTSLILNKSTNNNLSKLTNNPLLINSTNTIVDNNNQFLNISAAAVAAKNLTTSQQTIPNNNQNSNKQDDIKLDDNINKQNNDIFISNSTNLQNQKNQQQQQQQKTISSQPDLNSLVLSSIGQVFSKSTASSCLPSLSTSLPTTLSNNNQSSEFDLSTILGYSMLMKMQQQFTLEQQQKKLKENN